MQRGFLFPVVEKYERANACKGCLPGAGGVNLGGWDAAPCQRARAGRRRRMLLPPSRAEQLLGKELLCSSFHQRKCQRSKLCCQMPHGHQMFPMAHTSPGSEGRAARLTFIPPALSSSAVADPSVPGALGCAGQLSGFTQGGQVLGGAGGPSGHP